MKNILSVVIIILFSTIIVETSSAQVLKRLQKAASDAAAAAAERKVEEKVNQKVTEMTEKAFDSAFDSIFGPTEGGSSSGGASAGSGNAGAAKMPFFFGANITKEPVYSFDTVVTYEMESIAKNGKSEGTFEMISHFNTKEQYTGTALVSEEMKAQNGNLFIIYDFKNMAMIMLMQSEEGKFSMGYKWDDVTITSTLDSLERYEEVNWDELDTWGSYRRIGTKNVAGYSSTGYEVSADGMKTEIWVSREFDKDFYGLFSANNNAKQLKGFVPPNYPYGMLMEMNFINGQTNERVTMKVTKVDQNVSVRYVMSEYPALTAGQQ
jgi:hypothetical protein